MEHDYRQVICWTLLLCGGVMFWFYNDIKSMEIDYERHAQLVDQTTGAKWAPSELMQLSKVLNHTGEYINSTNAQERLYDLEHNMNFENPFVIHQTYSRPEDLARSGWPVANQASCGQQLQWIVGQLNTHKNYTFLRGQLGYELTQYMDSFGKPEPGLYSGQVSWVGSYKQCLRASLNKGQIKTRYCMARMRPKWWPKNETIYPRNTIRIGACLPETCDTLSYNQHHSLIETLVKFDLAELYKNGLEFESMFCLPDERSPIRQIPVSGHIYTYVLCIWLAIVFTATIIYELSPKRNKQIYAISLSDKRPSYYESAILGHMKLSTIDKQITQLNQFTATTITNNNQPLPKQARQELAEDFQDKSFGDQLLESLAIRCSFKSFKTNSFRVKYNQGQRVRVDLGSFDFFKIIMALTVVLGHSAYLCSLYSRSLSNRIDINTNGLGRMTVSVTRCVDTFFVFFGVLTTYTLMRKFTTKQLSKPIIWFAVNLGVLLRISPVFMLVYWYSRSISPYTGSGPWWDYGLDKYSMKGVCVNDKWWRSIPYFGSHGNPPVPTCVLPGWFIVSYSQISILLPFITYILCKLPTNLVRFGLITFLSLASALQVAFKLYTQTSVKEEAFTLYGSFLTDLLEKFQSSGYLSTLSRLGSVSVGCYVGYLLRRYELGSISCWPKWLTNKLFVGIVVILHVIIIFLPLIGYIVFQQTQRITTLEEFISFNVLIILFWPLLNGVLILTGTTIWNHTVMARFCSHTFWHVFNRLGLCIYLVHWEVIFVSMTSFEHAPSYGFVTDVMKTWAFSSSFSILLAFVIHILIEAPLSALLMLMAKVLGQQFGLAATTSQQNDTKVCIANNANKIEIA